MVTKFLPLLLLALALPAAADTSFYRQLLDKEFCTFEDACRAAYILYSGENPDMSHDEILQALLAAELLPEDAWDLQAQDAISKGEVSYMICEAADISGGVMMHLLGTTCRYAYKELVYLKILAPGRGSHRYVKGEELLSILRRASRYKKEGKVD